VSAALSSATKPALRRADDRGRAVSGEASGIVVDSTISRNLAVAHIDPLHDRSRRSDSNR